MIIRIIVRKIMFLRGWKMIVVVRKIMFLRGWGMIVVVIIIVVMSIRVHVACKVRRCHFCMRSIRWRLIVSVLG